MVKDQEFTWIRQQWDRFNSALSFMGRIPNSDEVEQCRYRDE